MSAGITLPTKILNNNKNKSSVMVELVNPTYVTEVIALFCHSEFISESFVSLSPRTHSPPVIPNLFRDLLFCTLKLFQGLFSSDPEQLENYGQQSLFSTFSG